ncbi:MAG: hypothetical protein ONB44_07855 [candidate division KSB1 bacterium]|nr:hypothetical protein [candidate division KSB1 bacterium]MDZ7302041.1 hypothetical protein [candidate division KSB1 bacterium]MDZ7311083.1 hypothetical protein [candidate division KSB1 bacterium]
MITVAKLINELKKYPSDALAYAYEGEFIGIVIVDAKEQKQLGEIPASSEEDEAWQQDRIRQFK